MLDSLIPVILNIGANQKSLKVNRLASLKEVMAILDNSALGIPKPWHLYFNNTPLENWADAVQFFDSSGSSRLEITIQGHRLPQPGRPPSYQRTSVNHRQAVLSVKRLREENLPERDSLKRPRLGDGMLLKRKTLAQKTTKRQFLAQQSLPKAISKGNYRGGLSEYLMKDLTTRNHQLSFNTATTNNGRKTQFETCCILVLGGSTYQTVGVAYSKKKSIQQSAKKMLVTLGVIPPPIKQQSLSWSISQRNYRGGLSEYLVKDLKTGNNRLSYNTVTTKVGRRTQFETSCMLVLGRSTYQTVGVADSKKKSVHQSAKKMLVTLGVIPPPNLIKEQYIPNQQAPTHGLGAESKGGEDFNQGVGGGSPWTRFLDQQQKQNPVTERWTKAKILKHRKESQEVMWEQIQIMMKPNKAMNVMMMKDEFPGPKEKRPRITALRIMLGRKLQEGLVRVEKKGKKSKWLWTLLC